MQKIGTEISHYLVVAVDIDRRNLAFPSALSVAKTCLAAEVWGIGERTLYRSSLKKGDKLLIYIGGIRETPKSFVAEAEIAGPVQSIKLSIQTRCWPLSLPLSNCRWLPNPVPIHPILDQLKFVANPKSKKWGSCLQAGIVKISQADFELVKQSSFLLQRH